MLKLAFNELEQAVLLEISNRESIHGAALGMQLATAHTFSTENTGAGFYTSFHVDRSRSTALNCKGPLGSVWSEIDDFEDPMTFVLWTKDGYADCLEGASVRDSTVGFDFDVAKFRVLPATIT